jgi:hypothetical protein
VDGDGILGLVEEHAVVADAKPEQPFELPAQRLDPAGAGCRITVNSRQNVQSGALLDSANFFRDVRLKANLLHSDLYPP